MLVNSDIWPYADREGENSAAVGDKFVGLGFKGDRIDTKLSAEGDKGEGFEFEGDKMGTTVSAKCDREDEILANVESNSAYLHPLPLESRLLSAGVRISCL